MSGLDDLIKGVTGGKGGGGLGDILGGVLGGVGRGGAPSGMGGMLAVLLPLLGSLLAGGGLQRILSGLQANGLSAQADSWVSTGANEPVSGDAIRQVLGDDELSRIAEQLGVSHEEAAAAVADVLPLVVDHATPEGRLPDESGLDAVLGSLRQVGAAG